MLYRCVDAARNHWRSGHEDAGNARGRLGEDIAQRYLQKRGFTIVGKNYRTRSGSGEVDLIGWDGPALVFVEVKSRSSQEFGTPDQAVDKEKRERLLRAAGDYLVRSGASWDEVRFDIVNVLFDGTAVVQHLVNVFNRPKPL